MYRYIRHKYKIFECFRTMNNTKSYYTFSGVVLLTFNQNSSVLNIKKNTNIKCTSLADPGAPPLTAADI